MRYSPGTLSYTSTMTPDWGGANIGRHNGPTDGCQRRQLMEPYAWFYAEPRILGRRRGAVVGAQRCVASKIFPQLCLHGRDQLRQQHMRGVECHVQVSLAGVPQALVGQAHSRVCEVCHCLHLELYPRLQWRGSRNGQHHVLCLGHPLPVAVPQRRPMPYHGGALHATSSGLWERGHSQVLLEACM